MVQGQQIPDCPGCGYNPIRTQQDSEVDQLLTDLQSSDANIRNNAAVFLGQRGEKKAAEPLFEILRQEGAKAPVGVLMALGDLKEERAVDLLLKLMPDSDLEPNAHMLGWGTRALAKIGNEKALKGILRTLRYVHEENLREVIKSYIELGKKAVPILIEGLNRWNGKFPIHIRIRKELIWALGEIGDQRASGPLKDMLQDMDKKVVVAAKTALRKMGI